MHPQRSSEKAYRRLPQMWPKRIMPGISGIYSVRNSAAQTRATPGAAPDEQPVMDNPVRRQLIVSLVEIKRRFTIPPPNPDDTRHITESNPPPIPPRDGNDSKSACRDQGALRRIRQGV